jgi:hypothetical protein
MTDREKRRLAELDVVSRHFMEHFGLRPAQNRDAAPSDGVDHPAGRPSSGSDLRPGA